MIVTPHPGPKYPPGSVLQPEHQAVLVQEINMYGCSGRVADKVQRVQPGVHNGVGGIDGEVELQDFEGFDQSYDLPE